VIPQLILTSVIALAAARHLVVRRAEHDVTARLPVGPDGIIPGAQSIAIDPPGARSGVLLLHGFGDTPQSLRYLAEDLGGRGYAVRAPLLPGHGRTIRAFARSRSGEWLGAARAARDALQGRCDQVAIVGQSMGGAVAVMLAAERPPAALILLAPYLAPSPGVRRLARWGEVATLLAPYVGSRSGERSIHDPAERARTLGYGLATPRLLAELARLAARAESALGEVRSPTLVIQSRDDHRVAAEVAERAIRSLAARHTRLEWVEGCGHVLTVDRERDRVFALVRDWLSRHAPAADGIVDASAAGEPKR
jgi:carboxylesterase